MTQRQAPALAPVRAALLRGRRGSRRPLSAAARARGSTPVIGAAARRRARRGGRAGSGGGAAGTRPRVAAAERSRGRGEARTACCSAQRDAYDELRARVRDAVARPAQLIPATAGCSTGSPRMARRAAGPAQCSPSRRTAACWRGPPGVVVDCSLARLADRAVQALGAERAGAVDTMTQPGRAPSPRRPGERARWSRCAGLAGVAMYDIIELGERRLPGEAVAIRGDADDRAGLRVHRRPRPGRRRPAPAASRCPPGSARTCSAASSTGCCARWPARPPGWSPATVQADRGRPGLRLHARGGDGRGRGRRASCLGSVADAGRRRLPGAGAARA